MKNLKNYLFLAFLSLSVTSCLVDDEVISDTYASSPSVAGFSAASLSANASATGDVVPFTVPLRVVGPNLTNINEDVTVTYQVNTLESTAIEGTHFTLSSNSTVLSANNNLFGNINLDIITAGITPPLAVSPVLVLDIISVSGGNGALVNGRTNKVTITINYLCFSDLAGDYYMVFSSGTTNIAITQVSAGVYQSDYFPTFVSTYWFQFSDVCDVLTISDWQYQASNPITGTSLPMPQGTVNGDGDLTFTGVNVAGVSWYVDRTWTILKY